MDKHEASVTKRRRRIEMFKSHPALRVNDWIQEKASMGMVKGGGGRSSLDIE